MNREDTELPGSRPVPAVDTDASVVGLLRQLSREVPALFTKELALAKAELQPASPPSRLGLPVSQAVRLCCWPGSSFC